MKQYSWLLILSVGYLFQNSLVFASFSKEFIAQFLPKNPIILEAGAHNGSDTLEISRMWPHATIYAFEPIPHLFQQLQARTKNCHNVTCIQKALSNTCGYSRMYVSKEGQNTDASSSLLEPTEHLHHFPHVTFPSQIVVETTTLDAWAQTVGLDHIDFIWFDLQGMEPFVLAASSQILKTVRVIVTEVSYTELYKQAPLYPEFKQWMEHQGFKVMAKVDHHPTFGDVLFVRK